ncbi:RCC1 domain-containing protein [Psychrobacter sp.]|uniref:RCC1 domain-containing protein n=1 Tax=Psychrobacter sp. TaxID=56811 RepID=UPI003C707246
MQKPMNFLNRKIIKSLVAIIIISTLPACDKTPSEHLQSLTEDKYPVANMPDEPLETPLEINIEPKRLAMTSSWSAGVKDDGTLWTWGTDGLLRDTKTGQDPTPRQVEGVNDAVAVSGAGHMLLLRKDGTVWGWGSNSHGEIDPSDGDIFIEELRQIKGIENVVDIAAGEMDSIFLTNNGEVYVLGSNEGGWVNEIPKQLIIPTKVPNLSDIIRIEFRNGVLLALDKKGELYSTGKSERALGRLLYQSQEPEIEYHPAAKVALPKKTIDFSVTSTSAMAVLEDGSVWNWGSNSSDNLALSDSEDIKMPEKNPYLHKVVNIGIHAAVTSQGDLYTWRVTLPNLRHLINRIKLPD